MTTEEFTKFLEENIMTEKDKTNVFVPPLEPQVAFNILRDHFLGKDWYTANPIGPKQVNTEVVYEILDRFPMKEDIKKNSKSFFKKIFKRK